jgi:hypothetical protein
VVGKLTHQFMPLRQVPPLLMSFPVCLLNIPKEAIGRVELHISRFAVY